VASELQPQAISISIVTVSSIILPIYLTGSEYSRISCASNLNVKKATVIIKNNVFKKGIYSPAKMKNRGSADARTFLSAGCVDGFTLWPESEGSDLAVHRIDPSLEEVP